MRACRRLSLVPQESDARVHDLLLELEVLGEGPQEAPQQVEYLVALARVERVLELAHARAELAQPEACAARKVGGLKHSREGIDDVLSPGGLFRCKVARVGRREPLVHGSDCH